MSDVIYSELHALALQEPWRLGLGHVNALDPTWSAEAIPVCEGDIEWEHGTGWWECQSCGRLSWVQYTTHYPAVKPWRYFLDSVFLYFARRTQQGVSLERTVNQALFISGMTLRYAGVQDPDQLGQYAQALVIE